jgi:hypothetical protein
MLDLIRQALARGFRPFVSFTIDGKVQWSGVAEYVSGSWVGIRQANGRLDEVPGDCVEIDPT